MVMNPSKNTSPLDLGISSRILKSSFFPGYFLIGSNTKGETEKSPKETRKIPFRPVHWSIRLPRRGDRTIPRGAADEVGPEGEDTLSCSEVATMRGLYAGMVTEVSCRINRAI